MDGAVAPADIGHNSNAVPLAELLVEETTSLKERADALVASAGRAAVTDDDTAGKATTLCKMLVEHAKAIDAAREERKRPFLEAGRTVDSHFKALAGPVDAARIKVLGLVDGYRRKKEAEAAAERRRLEEEARQAREAAEAAAREASNGDVEAELAARQQEERAAELARQAESVAAAPIDTGLGIKAHGRKVYRVEITDLTAALKHCRKVNEAEIRETVEKIYQRQVRAGVRDLPGAKVIEDSATTIR